MMTQGKVPMTGILLAGGKSSRMGKNKALLPFEGKTVLEHLGKIFSSVFEQTLIIVDDKKKYCHLDSWDGFFYEDLVKDRGPLGGLATGFFYAVYPICFVSTCDMPLIHESFIRSMIKAWKGEPWDALCTENPEEGLQPFPAIYKRENRSLIRVLLDVGHLSLHRLFEVISVDRWPLLEEFRSLLINMNTPEDYAAVLEKRKVFCGQ